MAIVDKAGTGERWQPVIPTAKICARMHRQETGLRKRAEFRAARAACAVDAERQKIARMTDRKSALSRLVVGDIFHATCPNGASLICLVEAVTHDRIEARRVTTQHHVTFDRATGQTLPLDDEAECTIDSIAPLPIPIHNVMLGLDRKMRLITDNGPLDEEEKAAFRFIVSFYPAHPLRSDDESSKRPN